MVLVAFLLDEGVEGVPAVGELDFVESGSLIQLHRINHHNHMLRNKLIILANPLDNTPLNQALLHVVPILKLSNHIHQVQLVIIRRLLHVPLIRSKLPHNMNKVIQRSLLCRYILQHSVLYQVVVDCLHIALEGVLADALWEAFVNIHLFWIGIGILCIEVDLLETQITHEFLLKSVIELHSFDVFVAIWVIQVISKWKVLQF